MALGTATLPPSRAGWVMGAVYVGVAVGAVVLAPSTLPVTLLLACGGMVVGMSAIQLDVRSRLRRALDEDPHREEAYTVEVGEEGIRTYCDHVDTRITWSGITRVVAMRDCYVFVRGATGGATVPRRTLSAADDERLREMVRQWSPDGGAGLPPAHPV